jgi:Uma2 family endonuclease
MVLSNISWETYERLLADHVDQSSPRLTYDQGTLEIMSPGPDHEEANRTLARLVYLVATELGLRVREVGSMTYKRPASKRGLEPDSSFYVEPSAFADPKRDIDVDVGPAPNLAIEIDMSRSSIPKLDLYAGLGVFEVWVWDDGQARFYVLGEGAYEAVDRSQLIPPLTPEIVTRFVVLSRQVDNIEWYRSVQTWAQTI